MLSSALPGAHQAEVDAANVLRARFQERQRARDEAAARRGQALAYSTASHGMASSGQTRRRPLVLCYAEHAVLCCGQELADLEGMAAEAAKEEAARVAEFEAAEQAAAALLAEVRRPHPNSRVPAGRRRRMRV